MGWQLRDAHKDETISFSLRPWTSPYPSCLLVERRLRYHPVLCQSLHWKKAEVRGSLKGVVSISGEQKLAQLRLSVWPPLVTGEYGEASHFSWLASLPQNKPGVLLTSVSVIHCCMHTTPKLSVG